MRVEVERQSRLQFADLDRETHALSNDCLILTNGVTMKGKMAGILLAGTMFAITGATLPASATVLNTNGQHLTGGEQEALLLAAKGKEPVKGGDSKGKENTVKGGHSTGKSPSKQETHQKGEARRHQDQNVNPAFKEYKKHGGKLSKAAWLKQGQPKR